MSKKWECEKPKPTVILAVILTTVIATLAARIVVEKVSFLNKEPKIYVMYKPVTDLEDNIRAGIQETHPYAIDAISISQQEESGKLKENIFFAGSISKDKGILIFSTETVQLMFFEEYTLKIVGDVSQIEKVEMKNGGIVLFEKKSPHLPKIEGENIRVLFDENE